jgi:amidase
MNRRTFLTTTALSASVTACQNKHEPAGQSNATAVPSFELDELTISDLAEGMRSGRWNARKLTQLYLERIDALNLKGPQLRAVIETNPDALTIAEQLDRERKDKGARGPLHGIPILIKDNIDTADKMSTSAGSLALEGSHAARDSFVAVRLRAAGAIILGKTNLSEWANFRSTHSISGWSGRGGQTRNPYALDRNTSGSSSGSGAGVAANLCAAAIGSETDGSIVSPSSVNGVVGVKPTVGLISRSGIIPISHSQDTGGPMTRTVRDAALLLTALAGLDPDDSATAAAKGNLQPDYTKFLDVNGLKGARLGIARKFFDKNAPMDRFLSHCVDDLKRAGAEIVDPADLPSHGKWGDPENEVLLYEFKADLNAYLARLAPDRPARTLKDLIAFNERNRDREMPYFDQELFIQSEAKGPLTEANYLKARADSVRLARGEGIDALMEKYKLQAIVALTNGPAWIIDLVNGDYDTGGCSTPAAVAGYPHVTVPAGLFRGLPIGLSFFGSAWGEPTLVKLAYAYEQATKARPRPRFLPTMAGEPQAPRGDASMR